MRTQWHVGDVVRKMREQRGWSVMQLADRAGVNKATISGIENGQNLGSRQQDTFTKIASALDAQASDLYAYADALMMVDAVLGLSRADRENIMAYVGRVSPAPTGPAGPRLALPSAAPASPAEPEREREKP